MVGWDIAKYRKTKQDILTLNVLPFTLIDMKILICGGHVGPALAVIQHLPKNADIVYVGRKHPFEGDSGVSLEYQVIHDLGIQFIDLQTGRLQRKMTRHTIPSLVKFPFGIQQAVKIVHMQKPDVVLGLGGYISLSVGIAATLEHRPLVIHEQTLHAGIANKILAKFATKIVTSWESSGKYFPKSKTVLLGNPHLKANPSDHIQTLFGKVSHPIIVVTGGSSGSHGVNVLIEKILPQLLQKYYVVHQMGDAKEFSDFERITQEVKAFSKDMQQRYFPMKFIQPEDVDFVYEKADLVIGRSGINTITSLILLKKHAVLIPLLNGQKNEQMLNAEFLKSLGLGEIFHQNSSEQVLLEKIEKMMQESSRYNAQEIDVYQQLHQQSAMHLVELLYVVAQTNSEKKS